MYYPMVCIGFVMIALGIAIFILSGNASYDFKGEKKFKNWLYKHNVLLFSIGGILILLGFVGILLGCAGLTWWK